MLNLLICVTNTKFPTFCNIENIYTTVIFNFKKYYRLFKSMISMVANISYNSMAPCVIFSQCIILTLSI